MGARRPILIAALALLAGAAVALPTTALSETSPSVEAVNEGGGGIYGETHRWSPAATSVASGGSVTFSNPTGVAHGIYWSVVPAVPVCSGGVPVQSGSGTHWSGTCSFATPGVYNFYCTVHGPSMSGTVTVEASGTTTVTPTPTPNLYPTTTSPQPQGPTEGGGGSPAPAVSPTSSGGPLAGSRLFGLSGRTGASVKGLLQVPAGAAGASAEIDLLAPRALVANGTRAGALVLVGRTRRADLHAGRIAFAVRLDAKARRALRVHHRLALVVRVSLRAGVGASLQLSRAVLLRG